MLKTREAVVDDFDDILRLFQQMQHDKPPDMETAKRIYREMISSSRHFGWVATENGKIIGYIDMVFRTYYYFAFDFTARIETTIVDEKLRRKGIATKMIERCEEKAREMGCKAIEVDSSFHREVAHKFYEKNGYEKRGYLFWKKL